jgi:hypothetical protein
MFEMSSMGLISPAESIYVQPLPSELLLLVDDGMNRGPGGGFDRDQVV